MAGHGPTALRRAVPINGSSNPQERPMHTHPECDDIGQSYFELQRLRRLVELAEKRRAVVRCGRRLKATRRRLVADKPRPLASH